jgi:NAD(P)H-dependent flavin oxidoreductase YrpB (nitropropane dioxygenase family)
MLTYSDVTIWNALDIFHEMRDTGVRFVGCKDVGLPKEKLRKLVDMMKNAGRTVFMEVVSESEEATLRSVRTGIELGVDYLIGGAFVDRCLPVVKETGIKYFPYIGKIVGHPCLLRGSIEDIVVDAKRVEKLGVDGINLLAYRYDGDVEKLIREVQRAVKIPLVIAGSIDSLERVKKMVDLQVFAFTIGGAVLEKKFSSGNTVRHQIVAVLNAIK